MEEFKQQHLAGIEAFKAHDFKTAEDSLLSAIQGATVAGAAEQRATSQLWLADVYKSQAKYDQAKALYEEAIQTTENLHGPDSEDVAWARAGLAGLYLSTGRYQDAEAMISKAMPAMKKAYGEKSAEYARLVNDLGSSYYYRERYDLAEATYRKALETRTAVLGEKSEVVAESLDNLGAALFFQGKLEDSERVRERAVATYRKALGAANPDYAVALSNLAETLRAQKKLKKARKTFEESLEILRKVYGPSHPSVATCLNNLSAVRFAEGDLKKAEELIKEAISIREGSLGPRHPDTVQSLENYVELLRSANRLDEMRKIEARLRALTSSQDQRLQELLANLHHPNGGFKDAVALVQYGADAVSALVESTEDAEARVRSLSCFALGEIKVANAQVIGSLQSRLTDEDHRVRYSAVRALGSLKPVPPSIIDKMETVRRKDSNPSVRDGAAEALLMMTGTAPAPTRGIADLLSALDSPDILEREEALGDIGRLGLRHENAVKDDRVLKRLIVTLEKDDYEQNRVGAALALWRIGLAPEFVVAGLTKALDDGDPLVQTQAAQILGNFGPAAAAALPRLKSLAAEKNRTAASTAQSAIDRIAPR